MRVNKEVSVNYRLCQLKKLTSEMWHQEPGLILLISAFPSLSFQAVSYLYVFWLSQKYFFFSGGLSYSRALSFSSSWHLQKFVWVLASKNFQIFGGKILTCWGFKISFETSLDQLGKMYRLHLSPLQEKWVDLYLYSFICYHFLYFLVNTVLISLKNKKMSTNP